MASAVVKFVFAGIKSWLVNAGVGATVSAVIAGVITGGLAIGTARAFGSMLKPDIPGVGPNQGTRIQLAPDTGNKLQVCYGNVLTSGPVCDANISNQNKTMHFFIVLSEETDSGTFTIGNQGIRFGDKKLIFGSGATAHQITGVYDANGTTVNNWSGAIRVRVYAGGTASSNQIFPVPGGSVTAVAATTMMPHWDTTTNYKGTDLVFAMIELDYNAEEGLTNMDAMTFDLRNSLRSPGNVVLDYMQNSRYGAGISSDLIDSDSFIGSGNTSVGGYADESVSFTQYPSTGSSRPRYEINGVLSTFDDVKTNLDKLMMSCGSFLLFDGKQGKYKGLPNKIYPDQANCFVANDDNIISKIQIQNTDLYQMYNQIEVEYFDEERRDQKNTVFIEIPSGDRNTGEPDNKLSYSMDMVNNKVQTSTLANIDLNQTRLDTVIQFTGDHSFLQVDVGDVIKVTNSTYGFTDKLFRVMRIKEKENDDSTLNCDIIGLEYADTVYGELAVTTDPPFANITIPTIPIIGPIVIPGVLNGEYANLTLDAPTFGNVLLNQHMKTFGAGTQLTDNPAANTTVVSGTSYLDIIPEESYDITGADVGDYEVTSKATLGGTVSGAYDVAFRHQVKLRFANTTATVSNVTTTAGGTAILGFDAAAPPLIASNKLSIDPTSYGLPADMEPVLANVVLQGYSTVGSSNAALRSFNNLNYQMIRVTKGEK